VLDGDDGQGMNGGVQWVRTWRRWGDPYMHHDPLLLSAVLGARWSQKIRNLRWFFGAPLATLLE
jgi:hypothetical protein